MEYTLNDDEFNKSVDLHARVMMRTVNEQLFFWARLGKACEDCPNHKYAEIRNDLLYMESDGEEI